MPFFDTLSQIAVLCYKSRHKKSEISCISERDLRYDFVVARFKLVVEALEKKEAKGKMKHFLSAAENPTHFDRERSVLWWNPKDKEEVLIKALEEILK